MDTETNKVFFSLLRSAVCGNVLSEEEKREYSEKKLPEMVETAKNHDISHLLALGLKKNDLLGDDSQGIKSTVFAAVYRNETLMSELDKLCGVLEEAHIPFIPLKGSVIRKYYPEAWMRTSGDIDILLHPEDLEKAIKILTEEYGCSYYMESDHDISLLTPGKVHIELHHSLIEEGRANRSSEILMNAWDNVRSRDGFSFWYEMSDAMFYFYHIAHMAKHLENGGCGVRSFIDLWILDNIDVADHNARNELLRKGGLLKFADVARKLSHSWFGGGEYDAVSRQMEEYILLGGTFGRLETGEHFKVLKMGGRVKRMLSKIFVSYKNLKNYYPVLNKHWWLFPLVQVQRWGKLIFCGHLKRSTEEIKKIKATTNEEVDRVKQLLDSIGL